MMIGKNAMRNAWNSVCSHLLTGTSFCFNRTALIRILERSTQTIDAAARGPHHLVQTETRRRTWHSPGRDNLTACGLTTVPEKGISVRPWTCGSALALYLNKPPFQSRTGRAVSSSTRRNGRI